jgi:hypothetical protein
MKNVTLGSNLYGFGSYYDSFTRAEDIWMDDLNFSFSGLDVLSGPLLPLHSADTIIFQNTSISHPIQRIAGSILRFPIMRQSFRKINIFLTGNLFQEVELILRKNMSMQI